MSTTSFIDKDTIIEASWLNDVDATIYQALNGAATPAAARAALDVPQETQEVVPQVRVNGLWQALSASVGPLHASTHGDGGTDELDHDTLVNGLGNKHIDHSGVSIQAGAAMTGGGDLTTTRTLAFSHVLAQNLSANNFRITNLVDPSTNQDAATKVYVDTRVIDAGGTPWVPGVTPNSTYYNLGFVGIGTDTPIYDLDVRGTGQITEAMIFGDDVAVSGKVGIGIAPDPALSLLVNGDAAMGAVQVNSTLSVTGAATLPTITGPTVINGDLTLQ